MTSKKIHIIYLMGVLLMSVITANAQNDRFKGVSFRDLHLSKEDSACLRINSIWYTGQDQYGDVGSNESFYNKWVKEKEKYYPIMKEAWTYCITHVPFQGRVYDDGVLLNQWMYLAAEDSLKKKEYYDEMMKIYDSEIENIDTINLCAQRQSERTSVGGLMMKKARKYLELVIPNTPDPYQDEKAQELFVAAGDRMRDDIKSGKDIGGDIDYGGMEYYLGFAINDYVKAINSMPGGVKIPNRLTIKGVYDIDKLREMGNVSEENIQKIAQRNREIDSLQNINKKNADDKRSLRDPVLDRYNLIVEFCTNQIQALSKDYIDTLSTEGTDSVDVVLEKVVAPYNELKDRCNMYMAGARINVNYQSLADVEAEYANLLQSHKDSLRWLNKVKLMCEETSDFGEDNLFYYFYEDVTKCYEDLLEKIAAQGSRSESRQQRASNIYYLSAVKYMNQVRGMRGEAMLKTVALIIYYLNEAIRTDPLNAALYQRTKRAYTGQSGMKGEMMMAGIMEGRTITVNGVTFKVVLH